MRLVYVDDSGNADLTLYALIEVQPWQWSAALGSWLTLRRDLRDEFSIPVRKELHAVDFLAGRGNPSLDNGWNRWSAARLPVGRRIVSTLASLPIRWRVIYGPGRSRKRTYRAALENLQTDLVSNEEFAVVMIDGDGTDPTYIDAHRALALHTRRVVEDPWYQGSHSSQWIMMADWVAHLAFQHLTVSRPELADWYPLHLERLDVHGRPITQ